MRKAFTATPRIWLVLIFLGTTLAACVPLEAADVPAAVSSPIALPPTATLTAGLAASPTPSPAFTAGPAAESTPAPNSTTRPTPPLVLSPTVTAGPTAAAVDSPTVAETRTSAPVVTRIPLYTYRIIHTYPHDREAYTQGLLFTDGVLYESTGLVGASSLRKVALETGEVLQFYAVPEPYFGEGLTLFGDRLIQLTWKSQTGFVYDRESFALLGTFSYPTQGWGLTHDTQQLIMSDGSATLHFLDPWTFEELGQVQVYDDNGPVVRLNELEYIGGQIYANIYLTDLVARIDPESGRVTAWIDLAGLLQPEDLDPPVNVLNGIAYDAQGERLFVTGKLWPKLFEIELVPQPKSYLPFIHGLPDGEPAALATR